MSDAAYPTLQVIGDGWVQKLDKKYNDKFYYNRRTRKSTWTEPEVQILPPEYTNSEIKSVRNNSKEWIKVYSNDFNQIYYFNKETRTSVWDNPLPDNRELRESAPSLDTSIKENENDRIEKNMKLEEALAKLKEREKIIDTDTSDRFAVHKNIDNYKISNSEIDRSNLWRVNNKKQQQESVSNSFDDLKYEYDHLYSQLKILIDKNKDVKAVGELDSYAEDLQKRTKDMYQRYESSKNQSKIVFSENHENSTTSDVKDISDVEKGTEKEVSVADKKKQHKLRMLKRKKQEREDKKNSSLALFIDELEEIKEEKRAIEAEAEAKREAKKKFEHIRLLKGGKGDFYKFLGIEKDATSGKIKKAYLKLMIRYHPDKNKRKKIDGEETLTEKETTDRANLIKDAYQTLSDSWERFVYDTIGLEDYLIYQKVLQAFKNYIMSGVKIKKHGRRGRRLLGVYRPKLRYLWLDFQHEFINTGVVRILEITNEKERKAVKGVSLMNIKEIRKGLRTDVFKKTGSFKHGNKYFSIVGPNRTIDIECDSSNQREFLFSRINLLRCCKQKNEVEFKKHVEKYPFNKKKNILKKKKDKTKRKRIVKKTETDSEVDSVYDSEDS